MEVIRNIASSVLSSVIRPVVVQKGALLSHGILKSVGFEDSFAEYTDVGWVSTGTSARVWNASFYYNINKVSWLRVAESYGKWTVIGIMNDGSAIIRQLSGGDNPVSYRKVTTDGALSGTIYSGSTLENVPNGTQLNYKIDGLNFVIYTTIEGVDVVVDSVPLVDLGLKYLAFGVMTNYNNYGFTDITPIYTVFNAPSTNSNIDYMSLGNSISKGFGSTTDIHSYADSLHMLLRFNSHVKLSHNGSTVMLDGVRSQLIDQVNNVTNGFSGLITVMIGVNDYALDHIVGNADSALAKDFVDLDINADFAEGFRFTIETLCNKCPNATIVIIQPFYTTWAGAYPLADYQDIERSIASALGLNIIEDVGINAENINTMSNDGLHPNDDGYKLIAETISPTIDVLV